MNEFITDFIEGFCMGFNIFRRGKPEGTSVPPAGKVNRYGSKFIPREPEGVKDIIAHPGNAISYGIKTGVQNASSPVIKKALEYPFWSTVGLGLASTVIPNWYNTSDYDNTAGIDIDQMVKYKQALNTHGGSYKDITPEIADKYSGIPFWHPYITDGENGKGDKGAFWDFVQTVTPNAANYINYRKGVENLIAPKPTLDWGRNQEGKMQLTDVLPSSRYSGYPKAVGDAKKLYESLRIMDEIKKNASPFYSSLVDDFVAGNTVSPKHRDAFYKAMEQARERLDKQDIENVSKSMFGLVDKMKLATPTSTGSNTAPATQYVLPVEEFDAITANLLSEEENGNK